METEVVIELTEGQIIELHYWASSGHKLKAITKLKKWVECDLRTAKDYVDTIDTRVNMGVLGQAKIVGDTLERKECETAQEVIGFSIRDIEEPTGYIAVEVNSSISQLAAYHAIKTPDRILYKKDDKFFAGLYYRFKKDIGNHDVFESIVKL